MADGKFISFSEYDFTGKTWIWQVVTRDGHSNLLGVVKWFSRWRCYAFFPGVETIFEERCLRDIASFCENETVKHRGKSHG